MEEHQRLAAHYRQMCDGELCELAYDFADLTEAARQALRDEMRSRGLGEPEKPAEAPQPVAPKAVEGQEAGPAEYTWKKILCECESGVEAWQLAEALRRAGIESWIEGAGKYSPFSNLDLPHPRLLVAADQHDQARAVAAQPIPPEIVEASRTEAPAYEPPVCPQCGAADPILEGVEPENIWRCEQCDAQWTEEAANPEEEAQ